MSLFMRHNLTGGEEEPDAEPEIVKVQEPEEEHETPLRKVCFRSLWMIDSRYKRCETMGTCCVHEKYHMPHSICMNNVYSLNHCVLAGKTVSEAYDINVDNMSGRWYMCAYDMVGECPAGDGCESVHMPKDVEKQDLKELIAYSEWAEEKLFDDESRMSRRYISSRTNMRYPSLVRPDTYM
jgi:hypothetical protein